MIRTPPRRQAGIVVVAALLASACATAPPHRFIRGAGSGPVELMEGPIADLPPVSDAAIQAAVSKATRERQAPPPPLPTIEATDHELGRALRRLRERPDAAAHVRVGQAYARLGVLDVAIDYFDRAIRQDSRLAAAYDGRARIWRDWHMPAFAMGDARRAVYFAPASPVTHNTLGTVLLAIGSCRAARAAFERALALDPDAAYAAANLEWFDDERSGRSAACRDGERAGTGAGGPSRANPVDDAGAR